MSDGPEALAPGTAAAGSGVTTILTAIVEALGTAVIAGPDGRVVRVGSALKRIFEEAGEPLPETLPAGDCRRAVRNPNGVRCDRYLGDSPARRQFRLRLRPLDLLGEVYVSGQFEEVTAERQWVERLRGSAERAEQLLSVVSDYVFQTDGAGVVQEFSVRTQGQGALPERAFVGRHLWEAGSFVQHPDVPRARTPRPRQRAPLRRCLWRTRDEAGGERFLEVNAIPLFDRHTDAFLGFQGSATDITARLLAQADAQAFQDQLSAALRRLELKNRELSDALRAAQASDRAKSDFLAMMSHELRTPMNAIIGFSELMHAQAFGPLGHAKYEGYLEDILGSAQHLLGVINDILDYAKFQSGTMPLELEDTEIAALLDAARRFVEARAAEKALLIESAVSGQLTRRLDARKMKQVLLNLLSNAVKFTPPGGHIRIAVEATGDGGLELQVADTGPGIAPGKLDSVFQPFVQADTRLERLHEGTGLGLTLSKMIVEAHGGTLELESDLGAGTLARVRLPASQDGELQAPRTLAFRS